jgi:general secretion pathway protein N
MKKKFTIASIFILLYIGFLIATLPTSLVLNQLSLPKNITIFGVSGSIWNTDIAQVTIEQNPIQKVNAKLSFWSLFTLAPKVAITFGDSFTVGPEGELKLVLSTDKAIVNDLTVLMKANDIAQQINLPIPMTAKGDVELIVVNAELDLSNNNQCIAITGNASWSTAGVVALEQNVKLGNLTADISCDKGTLAVVISPKNDLGLTFTAYLSPKGKLSGNGYLKPGAKFPQELNDTLSFLGRKDRQGRYRLEF